MTKTRVFVFLVLLVFCITFVFVAITQYKKYSNSVPETEGVVTDTADTGVSPGEELPPPEPITHLTGMVQSLSENSFILKTRSPSDIDGKEYVVSVDVETRIARISTRNLEEMKAMMEEYQRDMALYQEEVDLLIEEADKRGEEVALPTPPSLPVAQIKGEEVTLKDLIPEQEVSVVSDEDVRGKDSFIATTIEILPQVPEPLKQTSGESAETVSP